VALSAAEGETSAIRMMLADADARVASTVFSEENLSSLIILHISIASSHFGSSRGPNPNPTSGGEPRHHHSEC
jgi:hypothetical protein